MQMTLMELSFLEIFTSSKKAGQNASKNCIFYRFNTLAIVYFKKILFILLCKYKHVY